MFLVGVKALALISTFSGSTKVAIFTIPKDFGIDAENQTLIYTILICEIVQITMIKLYRSKTISPRPNDVLQARQKTFPFGITIWAQPRQSNEPLMVLIATKPCPALAFFSKENTLRITCHLFQLIVFNVVIDSCVLC